MFFKTPLREMHGFGLFICNVVILFIRNNLFLNYQDDFDQQNTGRWKHTFQVHCLFY